MRWIVLALSLGAAIMSLIHGVFEMWISTGSTGFSVEGAGSAFTWITMALLVVSAIFALIGGVLAFNQRRRGGFFLIVSALLCFFAHPYTRYYGGIYLVGGIVTFFLRQPEYDDDENEDDEYDEDEDKDMYDDENEDEESGVSSRLREKEFRTPYGKRRERSSFKRNKIDLEEDNFLKVNESLRSRSSKVCPACGASVGIDHKFCHTCGSALHTTSFSAEPQRDAAAYHEPSPPIIVSVGDDVPPQKTQEDLTLFENFETAFPSEGSTKDADEGDELFTPPHRVFVKPAEDSNPILKRPVAPDESYRKFSDYTRRRRRKRHSGLRRVLDLSILLLAVGGVAWFFLGLRKVSENDLPPAPPPIESQEPAVPVAEPVIQERGLPALQIDAPARGVVVGSNVNMRPDHSIAGTALAKLNADTRVDVLNRWDGVSGNLSGPWFHIRTGNREGWIYGQYLQPLDARTSTLPDGYTASLLKTFGSSKEELTSQLGPPTRQTATTLTWPGLTANLRGDNEITRLQIGSAKHVLLNGLAVGISDEQLYKNVGYPSDYKGGQLRYIESGNQGMSVTMKNGKIQNITVGNI